MDKLKGTAVHKVVEYLTKGNVAERIVKGVVFGAGVSLVAAGASALIGAAGATVLVGGATAGIIGAGRFVRGFARSDAKKGRGMQKLEGLSALEDAQNTDTAQSADYFNEIHQHFTDKIETDISKEQYKRLKSVGSGVLGIALGAGLGFGLQIAADSGMFHGIIDRGIRNPFSQHGSKPELPKGVQTNVDTDIIHDPLPVDTPSVPEIPEVITPPEISYDPDFYVGSGEGGIEMFQSLGLNESNWYEVHQELLQNFPNDFYSMDGGTEVGMSHPGQLSIEAQQFIKAKFSLA